MRSVVITGTDTDIGKTFISATLMAGLPEYRYWKPIQSGLQDETDAAAVQRLAGCGPERIVRERYVFQAPLSPHAAAKLEGEKIDVRELLRVPNGALIVEGAGGALVPLNESTLYVDLFAKWKLPVIVVTRSTLGTINHTLLTLEALRSRKIEVLGCIMNGPVNTSNRDALEHYGQVEVLGCIEPIEDVAPRNLTNIFRNQLLRVKEVLR